MKDSSQKKCPKCETGLLKARVKRPFMVKYLLFWLPLKRYQCNTCHKKTYKFGSYPRKKLVWAK